MFNLVMLLTFLVGTYGSEDSSNDRCNVCSHVYATVDRNLNARPLGSMKASDTHRRVKASAGEQNDKHRRAVAMARIVLCKDIFGVTKLKCEQYVEEKNEDLLVYIKNDMHMNPPRRLSRGDITGGHVMCEKECMDEVVEVVDEV